jgi:hypothetical protein
MRGATFAAHFSSVLSLPADQLRGFRNHPLAPPSIDQPESPIVPVISNIACTRPGGISKKGLHPLQPRRADFTPITSDTQTWEKKMLKNFVKIRVGRMNVATITTSIRRHRGRYMPGKRFQEARMNPFQYKRTAKAA